MIRVSYILSLLALLYVFAVPSHATEQIAYPLMINGNVHYTEGFYLSKEMTANLKHFRKEHKIARNSANWNGFYAKLSVRENKLFATYLHIDMPQIVRTKAYPAPSEIFGVSIPADGLFADWFSGALDEPFGELDNLKFHKYVRIFIFENGCLVTIKEVSREEYTSYLKNNMIYRAN